MRWDDDEGERRQGGIIRDAHLKKKETRQEGNEHKPAFQNAPKVHKHTIATVTDDWSLELRGSEASLLIEPRSGVLARSGFILPLLFGVVNRPTLLHQ